MRTIVFTAVIVLLAPVLLIAADARRVWTFQDDPVGKIAAGFDSETGDWKVIAVGQSKALAQTAANSRSAFNLALANQPEIQNVDLSAEMTAVAGQIDQGGGLVWRANDARNYYLARYNPLEDNYRLYKLIDGKRVQLQNADIRHSDGQHTLRVTMTGDHIECYYDGQKYLDAHDATLSGHGKIGLWTKADARTQFANLTLIPH